MRVHFGTYGDAVMELHPTPGSGEHFGQGVGITVTAGDKLAVLREIGAFGLVDDRPETLERVADAGLWAAARSSRGTAIVAARADVHGFCDWREVPDLLPDSNLLHGRRDP